MARRQLASLEQFVDPGRQGQQPQGVGDMAAALADRLGQRLLGVRELVGQPPIGVGLLQRRQVGALQVLDQRQLERLLVGEVAHDDRHLVLTRPLCRPPAPLARHDLVARRTATARADEERLQDAALADRLRQRLELGLVESAARLQGRRAQELDRDPLPTGGRALALIGLGAGTQQRREAHAEAAAWLGLAAGAHAAANRRSRRSISPARWA